MFNTKILVTSAGISFILILLVNIKIGLVGVIVLQLINYHFLNLLIQEISILKKFYFKENNTTKIN